MDETNLAADANKVFAAQNLLDSDLFKEGVAAIERELIDAWIASSPRDTEGRERCWTAVQQVRRLKTYFEQVLANGKFAQEELKKLTEQPGWFRRVA